MISETPRLVGLGYTARSGKDTIADYLCEHHGWFRDAFGRRLKDAVKAIYGLTDEHVYGSLKEVVDPYWGETPRALMQKLGTECMRKGHREDVWIKALGRNHRLHDPNARLVITDVRYRNEAMAIQEWGGVVIEVIRPGAGASGGVANHSSEQGWGDFKPDARIINDSTLDVLYERVRRELHLEKK